MASRFDGKVAIVTGGGRGIGRAVASLTQVKIVGHVSTIWIFELT